MSGGGGSSSSGSSNRRTYGNNPVRPASGSGGGGGLDPCDITASPNLTNINPAYLGQVRQGMILDVQLYPQPMGNAIVCVFPGTTSIVGTVSSFNGLASLRNCILQGNFYEAIVTHVSGSLIMVSIRRV